MIYCSFLVSHRPITCLCVKLLLLLYVQNVTFSYFEIFVIHIFLAVIMIINLESGIWKRL